MRGIKFLHVIPYFIRATKSGGPAVTLHRLANTLIERGNEVTVACSTGNLEDEVDINFPGDVYQTEDQGIPTVYFRRNKYILPPTFYFSPSLPKWLDRYLCKFDIVILHGTWTYYSLAGWRACLKYRKPYMQYVHGHLDPWAFNYHNWKKVPYWYGVERHIYNNASGIVAVTQDEKMNIEQKGIKCPIRVIPNGISVNPLQAFPVDGVHVRFPILRGKKIILFMSRLHEKKGLEILLPAWANLHPLFPEFILVIAGSDEGGYRARLDSLINKLNIQNKVVFTGYVSGKLKDELLNNSSVFILPSYSEGLPNVVLEAMASRLPVIITPGCHISEVAQYNAGFISSPDIGSITKALEKLLSAPELRKQMGENAYTLIKEKFSQERMARDLETWCLEILEK